MIVKGKLQKMIRWKVVSAALEGKVPSNALINLGAHNILMSHIIVSRDA